MYQQLNIVIVLGAALATFYNSKKGPSTMSSKPSSDRTIDVKVQEVQFMVVRYWWDFPQFFFSSLLEIHVM
jgi:hypothetical protein